MKYITRNKRRWKAGCLSRTTKAGKSRFRVYGTDGTPPVIDRSLWDSIKDPIDPSLVWHIINQANQGSCCAAAGCGIMMLIREIAGLKQVVLSQASLYGQGNGGRDSGMAIDTCLDILMDVGACPVDLIDQYDWQGFRKGTWPDNWKEIAKRFRGLEAWDCPTLDHVVSANKLGFPVLYGAKGHAVVRIGRNLDINSWDYSWGDNGLGQWVSEKVLASEIRGYGAWALRFAIDPIDDGDLPQPKRVAKTT